MQKIGTFADARAGSATSGYSQSGMMAKAAMAKTNPAEFLREVRREVAKVTWPTRKETTVSTIMVFVMVILASIFFLAVDQIIGFGIRLILGIGG